MIIGEKLNSENKSSENSLCRQIVSEIENLEINDRQRMLIIYLLGLNVENIEVMREVTACVKELQSDIFLSDQSV